MPFNETSNSQKDFHVPISDVPVGHPDHRKTLRHHRPGSHCLHHGHHGYQRRLLVDGSRHRQQRGGSRSADYQLRRPQEALVAF